MRKLFQYFFALLCVTASSPQDSTLKSVIPSASHSVQDDRYKLDLLHAIAISDKIILKEHSYPFDAWDESTDKSFIPENIIYRSKEIKAGDKKKLLQIINGLDKEIQRKQSLCLFEPHHSIDFFENGKISSTMEICFSCNQIDWNGSKAKPPLSIYPGLEGFIKYIGFEPKRDWAAEAKKHQK